jgi:Ca-activated chloride channel family protein
MEALPLFGDFAFMRPTWLLGLLALPAVAWAWQRMRGSSGWESYIDPKKIAYLQIATPLERSSMRSIVISCLALALLALAGPSWRTINVPVQQTRDAMIIAFDLSPSMLATDLNPDRLTRARLKVIDLLRLRQEGETALIAYADDAYRVSPLTDDTSTIEALAPSLHPNIMPGPGSQVEAAVAMARQLLEGASLDRGVVLIVTDRIEPSAMRAIEKELGDRLRLCVLTVGSEDGVPIPMPGGGFARDARNQTILATVNRGEIASFADRHGGCHAELRPDDSDLEGILDHLGPSLADDLEESTTTFDIRQDEAHWIVLFLLPIVALAFRRNVFWVWLIVAPVVMGTPGTSSAVEWADLWQRADQRDVERLEGGVEAYRDGEYSEAAESFRGDSSLHHYNRANALALEGDLEEALDSYDRTLAENPDHADAGFNREVVRRLLERQEQQEQQEQPPQQGEDDSESQDQPPQEGDDAEQSGSGESQPQEKPGDPSQSDEASDEASDASSAPTDSEPTEADESEAEQGSAADIEGEQQESPPEAEAAAATPPEGEPLSDQSEQWLRNIPDDPGGLMRRKFEYQAEQRRGRGRSNRSETRY